MKRRTELTPTGPAWTPRRLSLYAPIRKIGSMKRVLVIAEDVR